MEDIKYQYDDQVGIEELFELMKEMEKSTTDRFPPANVFHYSLRNKEKEKTSLSNTVSVTARDQNRKNKLVGYLRLLTDQAYMFYILDVMVDPGYRKKGIGKEMLEITVNQCKKQGFIKICLTAIRGTEPLYEKFGFKEGMSPVLTIRGEDYI